MATKTTCDRCGREFSPAAFSDYEKALANAASVLQLEHNVKMDLCALCLASLDEVTDSWRKWQELADKKENR